MEGVEASTLPPPALVKHTSLDHLTINGIMSEREYDEDDVVRRSCIS